MTPDTALATRLAAMEATSQDHSPFSNLFERALCSAYRSGQLITIAEALLHKSGDRRTSPVPGQTHPAASVTGMPRAVKPFRTATRTWNSAT